MNEPLRPSRQRGILHQLANKGVGLASVVIAIGLICGTGSWVLNLLQGSRPASPSEPSVESANKSNGGAPTSPGERAAKTAGSFVDKVRDIWDIANDAAKEKWEALNTRDTSVFWLISHLRNERLAGGSGPEEWNSIEKCIAQLKVGEKLSMLNIQFGQRMWYEKSYTTTWLSREAVWPEVTGVGSESESILNFAIQIRDEKVRESAVIMLLDAGANPNQRFGEEGKTALITAAERGDSETVRILLEHKADINVKDAGGMTVFGYKISDGVRDVLEKWKDDHH